MSHFSGSWGGRPAKHLERLQNGLTALGQQVREAVARTIGQAVAEAARDGVRHLLGGPLDSPTLPVRRTSWDRERAPWRDDYDPDRLEDAAYGDWDEDRRDREEDDWRPPPSRVSALPWEVALATGCQAAAWWLRRQRGPGAALVALSVGLGTLLVCLARPVAPAAAVFPAVIGLASLTDAV